MTHQGLRRSGAIASTTALLALSLPAVLSAADPLAGDALARQWCASCHIVAPDQASGGDGAPPFAAIAANPALDHGALITWLNEPHGPMPDLNLTAREIDDLVAYIESLKTE